MKAGIFDPYIDSFGGGERYALSVAEALLNIGWEVDLFWKNEQVKEKLIEKFGLKIEKLNFVNYDPTAKNLFERYLFENKYNFLFYFSDGSVPFMFSKNNCLHFQVPFNKPQNLLLNKIKFHKIHKVVCNSYFTKKVIDSSYKIKSEVVYPPVDVEPFLNGKQKKENIILSVGRFSQLMQGKRQDALVEAFLELVKKPEIKNWKLILTGGSEIGANEFIRKLELMSKGLPIEIIENPKFSELVDLYSKSKIFWTAAGYGVDENINPEKVEHFGITTVEAMASGCVCIVQGKGGQKEIIKDKINGLLWIEKSELVDKTLEIIKNNSMSEKIRLKSVSDSKEFSKEIFFNNIYRIIK